MKLLLDTNVIMDALQERQPFDVAAKELLRQGRSGEIDVCFTANAASDIFYLYAKARDLQSARSAMAYLLDNYTVLSVTHEDCQSAMELPIDDFEDALVAACAKQAAVDYIITRDEQFLHSQSSVPLMNPSEWLKIADREQDGQPSD
jgi:predicted nucleic acid-binding protein